MAIIKNVTITAVTFLISWTLATGQTQRDAAAVLREPSGTLEKAARLRGFYVENRSNLDGQIDFDEVKSIYRSSSVVVLGTPTENKCVLTYDAKDVRTVYTFVIERIFKGKDERRESIRVALPGGRFTFADGSTAQINTPNYRKMVNGKRYLLFLSENPSEGWFVPTGGSQGIIEFQNDNKVLPHSQHGFKELKGYSQESLIEEVEQSKQTELQDPKR